MKNIDTDKASMSMTARTAQGLREKIAKSIRAARTRLVTVSASALFGLFLWNGMTIPSTTTNVPSNAAMSASESCAVVIEALRDELRKAYAKAAMVAFVLIIAGVVIDRLRADMEAGE